MRVKKEKSSKLINPDAKQRRTFVAPLFVAGYR
jgi:hypothetical protein